jgi:hypothetical protein
VKDWRDFDVTMSDAESLAAIEWHRMEQNKMALMH